MGRLWILCDSCMIARQKSKCWKPHFWDMFCFGFFFFNYWTKHGVQAQQRTMHLKNLLSLKFVSHSNSSILTWSFFLENEIYAHIYVLCAHICYLGVTSISHDPGSEFVSLNNYRFAKTWWIFRKQKPSKGGVVSVSKQIASSFTFRAFTHETLGEVVTVCLPNLFIASHRLNINNSTKVSWLLYTDYHAINQTTKTSLSK